VVALIPVIATLAGPPALAAAEPDWPLRGDPPASWQPSDAPLSWAQTLQDGKYLFTRPAHMDGSGWMKLGIGVGVGAALYFVRTDVRDFADRHSGQVPTGFLYDVRYMARAATPVVAATGFWLAGAARDSAYDKETATLLLENAAYASMIAGAAQKILVTDRPRDGTGISFAGSGSGHSISGDATMAASLLAPIIDRHLLVEEDDSGPKRFWKRFGASAMYGAAGLVAAQRVHTDAHWITDVYFGYLNGLSVGRILVDSRRGGREDREAQQTHRRVQVAMGLSGITISWR
jgi:membrane-associated phospholipid phosphatase